MDRDKLALEFFSKTVGEGYDVEDIAIMWSADVFSDERAAAYALADSKLKLIGLFGKGPVKLT